MPRISSHWTNKAAAMEPSVYQRVRADVRREATIAEAAAQGMFHHVFDVEAKESKIVTKGLWSSIKIAAKFPGESFAGKGPFMQLAAAFVAGTCCFETSEANKHLLMKLVDANKRLLDLLD